MSAVTVITVTFPLASIIAFEVFELLHVPPLGEQDSAVVEPVQTVVMPVMPPGVVPTDTVTGVVMVFVPQELVCV